jgi:phage tail-like protein
MARELASDFLHSMRFLVRTTQGNRPSLDPPGRVGAGFSMVTTPEASVEAVEYREGNYVYTRKYPGLATVTDITLSRGVARRDSSFWDWMRIVIEGDGEYRQDLIIEHHHRDTALRRATPANGSQANLTEIATDSVPARRYYINQGFPIRHKVAGDLDATAAEISIMEMDIAFEYFEVEEVTTP